MRGLLSFFLIGFMVFTVLLLGFSGLVFVMVILGWLYFDEDLERAIDHLMKLKENKK